MYVCYSLIAVVIQPLDDCAKSVTGNVWCVTRTYDPVLWSVSVTSVTMAPIRDGAPSVEAQGSLMPTTVRSAPFRRKM